jgi:hypothetical protein
MISMSVVSDARSRSAAEFAFAFGVVLRGVHFCSYLPVVVIHVTDVLKITESCKTPCKFLGISLRTLRRRTGGDAHDDCRCYGR